MNRLSRHAHKILALGISLGVVVGMLLLYIAQPALVSRLDLKIYDTLLSLRAASAPRSVAQDLVVIVDIDEASLAAYGQWPWPRYRLADLIDALKRHQVAAIGVDILFSEADRASPSEMRAALQRDHGLNLDFRGLPERLYDHDRHFAGSLAQAPAVLGMYGRFDDPLPTLSTAPPDPGIRVIARSHPGDLPFAAQLPVLSGIRQPHESLRGAAPSGFFNVAPDWDGIVRQAPLLMRIEENIYPSLALRTLMRALEIENVIVESGVDGLSAVRVGDYRVPVSASGMMHIPFIGPRKTYAYVSAHDVLSGALPPDALQGRIVFIGTSVPGLLDIRATPFDPIYPGVEIHAAVIDAILAQNAIDVPFWTPFLQCLGILFAGLAAAAAFGMARPRVYLPLALCLVAAVIWGARFLFMQGLFLSPLYIVLTIAAQGASLLFLRFWQEEKQKLILRNAFSHYVSPEIVKRITRARGDLLAGEERELSILFTDIRGFTSISERLTPQQTVALLNRYFTPMTALVRESGGTVDKFIGDALMAFWNAPLDVPNHAIRAVSAALAMQETLSRLNAGLQAEFGITLTIGAGIHTGPAYVGNMGSADTVNYTLIGDNVNIASRLEGLCAQYGVPVIVSEATKTQCGEHFAFRFLDTLRVKGKQHPISIYQALSMADGGSEDRGQETKDRATALRPLESAGAARSAACGNQNGANHAGHATTDH
ncbi:MAG: adenylate/guanylate cyclase domain-containing protein [Zoogloeaceae bacterium]|jgi:adenylate cyclase|nr:adenylate/guanylate cyclase domain-containing protein [Zoogloeaceae bacterium]